MRHNSPALSDDGAGSFFSEGGWDGRWGVGGREGFSGVFEWAADQSPSPQKR
ncbi:hypothetical protein CUS_7539 [Ruminococcus albus 8]|uniref:Uncharacterized protein n=1 Tax=Ruminococcus albus 8 TaxID=246199 RepID=E9SH11_RUMAL|nr:hypothetical protein CUS_7539 [Ruminococcus albus 8]